ncbi:unnamed protein product [Linum tenue]|uniref:mitogen-activated protein kinase n=1 Tax=Linum tenue TaxID=586396 RepID=A0AAV0JHC2_9ROSI|nr:unnamed protein product [Linum tenue]
MQRDHPKKDLKEMEFFTEYGDANRYKVLEVIGKGSYGVVCAAIDTHTGEKVAIKKIHDVFEHISDAIRILREVKLLRLLRHPDIVEIKRIMLPPSKREFRDIFVVFELMESDLHQVIKANDDLTREHHQFFLYQMLRALKYMHTVQDYVATRWYRAPELCGSFFSKYTPAIDIWSIGCIFAEVLIGKPLFPGKSVVHQLDIITDLLGTPAQDTISGVRNDKARKYLTEMRKKQPVPFAHKFPSADPLALRLLQRLLAFDPNDRPTAEEALADPYFRGLSKIEREPSCQPISKLEFEFERRRVTKDDIRELLYREILEYHPQLLKDYMSGNEGTNFLYPSAIGHFRKQFAYLEENSGRSAPVIPLERKHVSLPRPTVHSTSMSHNIPSSTSVDNHQVTDEVSKNFRGTDGVAGNASRTLRPPPRVPTVNAAKPGRVVGSVVPCDNTRNLVKDGVYDARNVYRNTTTVSPPCFFRTTTNSAPTTKNKSSLIDAEHHHTTSQARPQQPLHQQHNMMTMGKPLVPSGIIATEINNTNPYYHHHHQQQQAARVVVEHQHQQMNERIAIDAKLIQAQSHYGPAGAAAIAVAAHRNVGTVHYGLS